MGAFVLRVKAAFLAATRRLRVAAAFLPAVCRLRCFAVFLAAAGGFGVFAAFLAADFLEAVFDAAMFSLQLTTLLPLGLVRHTASLAACTVAGVQLGGSAMPWPRSFRVYRSGGSRRGRPAAGPA